MNISNLMFKGVKAGSPILIAGPCSAESRDQVLTTAISLKNAGIQIFRAGIWKPRTKPGGFEGVGKIGLEWLKEVKEKYGLLIATEVATPAHLEDALKADIDIIWIGARTTTNPFAVQDLANTLKGTDIPVLIKNPVNPDIELWVGAIERFYNSGIRQIGVIHRGFSSYENKTYRNIPLWHIPIELRRRFPNMTFFCDPSHIGGDRGLVASISQQALDLNFNGLIIESHCNPNYALSDANQQVTPDQLRFIISQLVVRNNIKTAENIEVLRKQIDEIDEQLLTLLSKRMKISKEIGLYKKEHNMPILQGYRYNQILDNRGVIGKKLNLDASFVKQLMQRIHEESVRTQLDK